MENLKLSEKHKKILHNFTQGVKDIYQKRLISIILYGSASSGEFVNRRSNLNLLVVLTSTDLENIKKASKLIRKFNVIDPLFLSEEYISKSLDVFPIEFLDMQENHFLIYGKDVLKGINIDMRNLRFQCEQELKQKLIKMQQVYLRVCRSPAALRSFLFASFTSILHIMRNLLRLKGRKPPYLKQEILKELTLQFKIDDNIWNRILAAKNKQIRLSNKEVDGLCISFTKELKSIIDIVDQL